MILGDMMNEIFCLLLTQAPTAEGPLEKAITQAENSQATEQRWWVGLDLWIEQAIGIGSLIIISLIVLFITRALRKLVIAQLIRRTKNTWDDVLVNKAFFRWVSFLPPTLIAAAIVPQMPGLDPAIESSEDIVRTVRHLMSAMTTISGMMALGALLDAGHEIYARRSGPNHRPIKSYISLVKLFIYIIGSVTAVAWTFGKDPSGLLTGIGAMTAVLMLVFKDTILSLVASVTLTQNDMVRIGDWIEIPGSADGDVIDMALHTVKIQNFDRTISTVPTMNLVNQPFKNWRNMSQGPGRRIKRSINLDSSTVRFLDNADIERLSKISVLRDYISGKRQELADSNKDLNDTTASLDVRRLTNIGTFRAYIYAWLRAHPQIHQGLTLLVRQLPPGPNGIPMEVYAFTKTTGWGEYEDILADLFDFLVAAVHEFDLKLFQGPTGEDVRMLSTDGPQHAQ
jgi:miniconductance mechanosensitive channel